MPVALRAFIRFALGIFLLALILDACGFSPSIADGTIGCGSGGACPPGFSCAADNRCYSHLGSGCGGGAPCPPGRQCNAGVCECSGCDSTTSDGCTASGSCQ